MGRSKAHFQMDSNDALANHQLELNYSLPNFGSTCNSNIPEAHYDAYFLNVAEETLLVATSFLLFHGDFHTLHNVIV